MISLYIDCLYRLLCVHWWIVINLLYIHIIASYCQGIGMILEDHPLLFYHRIFCESFPTAMVLLLDFSQNMFAASQLIMTQDDRFTP